MDFFKPERTLIVSFPPLTGYGMTELSPVCHMTPFENNKHGSVGLLLPNLRCKVRVEIHMNKEIPLRCNWHKRSHATS